MNRVEKYKSLREDLRSDIMTFIDCMPQGWRILCIDMFIEIFDLLKEAGINESFFNVNDLKEKWGRITLYYFLDFDFCSQDSLAVDLWSLTKAIDRVIEKYENISAVTCSECGEPAEYTMRSWVLPFCGDCAKKFAGDRFDEQFERIEEVN